MMKKLKAKGNYNDYLCKRALFMTKTKWLDMAANWASDHAEEGDFAEGLKGLLQNEKNKFGDDANPFNLTGDYLNPIA